MSPDQKALIQESWRHVVPIADTAATLFYDRLFEIDPDLRALFDGVDLADQRKKLIQALAMTVSALDDIDRLAPILAALGRRHADYGVTYAHYETVGAALLWTLETGLADHWNDDLAAAWQAAYWAIADIMRGAASEAIAA